MTLFVIIVIVSLSTFEGKTERFNGSINQCMVQAMKFNQEQKDAIGFCILEKESAQQPQLRPEGSHNDNEYHDERSNLQPMEPSRY
jgi:hypothetical protein